MLELYRKSNSAITLKFDFSRLKHMGNTNFPIKGKSCYVTRTGTGFRFPGAAEDKPEPSSGSRELPKTNRNRVPVPGSCQKQTGTGFRFPRAARNKPEPGSGSRELPEAKPEPSSGSRETPKTYRNRVPVLLLCRNRVYISSFFLSPRRSALAICFSHVFSVSQRRKSRSGSSSCTLSHASSVS